jgi:hypothetical protein
MSMTRVEHIRDLFWSESNNEQNPNTKKFLNNYHFCREIRNLVDMCIREGTDCIANIGNINGSEDNIDDGLFMDIIFQLYDLITDINLCVFNIIDNVQKMIWNKDKVPSSQVSLPLYMNNVIIADQIVVLDNATPHIKFFGEQTIDNIFLIEEKNKLYIKHILQNRENFEGYFNNAQDFQKNIIKKLLDIDRHILEYLNNDIYLNMEPNAKKEIRMIIMDQFKSQLDIMIKLICTMRTKIDFKTTQTPKPKPKPKPITKQPWMAPTRHQTGLDIEQALQRTQQKGPGPFGFIPQRGRGALIIQSGGEYINKLIYKEYKYLFSAYQYSNLFCDTCYNKEL